MLILSARRGVKSPDRVLPGLVLHDEAGITPAAQAVLREGHALSLAANPRKRPAIVATERRLKKFFRFFFHAALSGLPVALAREIVSIKKIFMLIYVCT